MAMVSGTVENVSTKFNKYSIQVNGNWYGTKMEWAKVKPNKGDVVEFDDGGGKYLKNVKVLHGEAGAVVTSNGDEVVLPVMKVPVGKEVSIIRQNALSHAAALQCAMVAAGMITNHDESVKSVIEMARQFEAYSAGWSDLHEAEEAAKELLTTVEE